MGSLLRDSHSSKADRQPAVSFDLHDNELNLRGQRWDERGMGDGDKSIAG